MTRKMKAAKLEYSSSEEDKRKRISPTEAVSDDDAEANEDLSFKIVQKAMQRAAKTNPMDDGVLEIVMNLKEETSKKEKKKRRKSEKVEETIGTDAGSKDFRSKLFLTDNVEEKEKPGNDNAAEVASKAAAVEVASKAAEDNAVEVDSEVVETNPVASSDNAVLRKLLRGPRYFDPPDNSWGACYNCGEEGHTTVNCTSARRKKPCFVCGSFEHNAKQCSKGRDCFICKQQGHRAKDCSERNKISKLCLKCGDLGHDMFSCRNDYSPDDLKQIQCYICGVYGHLCCKDYSDPGPREVSCYRCGLSGHTGLSCSGSRWDTSDKSHWDPNDVASAGSCYKCGIIGHFARECSSSVKTSKRNREPSTPKQKKKREHFETRSVPDDLRRTREKKKSKSMEFSTPAKTKKRRGDWIVEDDYSSKSNGGHWRSPRDYRKAKIHFSNGDYHHYSPSNHESRFHQRTHSASRFGNNSSNGGMGRRNNDWW